jgi:hypothetical protein
MSAYVHWAHLSLWDLDIQNALVCSGPAHCQEPPAPSLHGDCGHMPMVSLEALLLSQL